MARAKALNNDFLPENIKYIVGKLGLIIIQSRPSNIFATKEFRNELLDDAPLGVVGFCQENKRMSDDTFAKGLCALSETN